MNDHKELPLRIGVGIVVLNEKNKVFVGKRIDNPKNFWQMPQGGVEQNENLLLAAKRELKEETGIKSVELVKELKEWFKYDLPKNLLGKVLEGKYRGQNQKWFIMNFIGKDDEININTKNPEFLDWKWVAISELPRIAVSFKVELYAHSLSNVSALEYVIEFDNSKTTFVENSSNTYGDVNVVNYDGTSKVYYTIGVYNNQTGFGETEDNVSQQPGTSNLHLIVLLLFLLLK